MPEMVGFCLPTKESGSGAKVEAKTGLASTADAVNRKADVAFGRPAAVQVGQIDRPLLGSHETFDG
jgi:hypothetical protein